MGAPRSALPLLDSPRTLWILLASALLVRLWGIGYGLPYVYWIDEYHEVMRALELGTGHFNFERTGKGGFYLLLFFEFGLYVLVLKAAGFVSSVQQFAEQFVRDPTPFYLMGRATAAAFGCATVAAAYWVGRRAYGAHAGLVGAAFLAFNVLHVDLSHRVGVDVPMTMLATLTIVFALQIVERGELRDYALAALSAALATTTKLPGLLLLLPLLIAHMYRMGRSGQPWTAWITSRRMWIAFLLFCAVLIATNPAVVLHFDPLAFYSSDHNDALEAGEIPGDSPGADSRPNLHGYYLNVLLQSMGWPLFGLSLIAVGHAALRRRPADIILLSYATVTYVAITSTTSEALYYPRYALPIIVVLAILGGRTFCQFLARVPRWHVAATVSATAIILAFPLSQSVKVSYSLTQTDTRTRAKAWFDEHVPPGSRVLIEGSKIAASRLTVPLADSRESLEHRIAYWEVHEPRQAKYLEMMRTVSAGGGYRLELIRLDSVASLDDYLAGGIEYFVVRPQYFASARKAGGGSARLLLALRSDPRLVLLQRFEAPSSTYPGPLIEIYGLRAKSSTRES